MAGTGSHFLGHLFKKQLGRGRHDNTSFRNRSKEVAEAKAASSAVNKVFYWKKNTTKIKSSVGFTCPSAQATFKGKNYHVLYGRV